MLDVGRSSRPWKPQGERAFWADGLDMRVLEPGDPPPEILYWVGCAASFDERARESARATASLLLHGRARRRDSRPRESCTGGLARRMGDEYTFQAQARENVATLDQGDANRHELSALLQHAWQRVRRLRRVVRGRPPHGIARGTAARREARGSARGGCDHTSRRSCYLARHNDVIAAPARSRTRIGKAARDGAGQERTFCCGAGGAHMWMEERGTADQRGARPRGDGLVRKPSPLPIPVLHDDARRRRQADRVAAPRRGRVGAPGRGD